MWRWNVSILNLFWIFTLVFWITTVLLVENVLYVIKDPNYRFKRSVKYPTGYFFLDRKFLLNLFKI